MYTLENIVCVCVELKEISLQFWLNLPPADDLNVAHADAEAAGVCRLFWK